MKKFKPLINTNLIIRDRVRFVLIRVIRGLFFLCLFISCKTVQEEPVPLPEPEPEPVLVLNSYIIFNMISNPTTGYDWEPWVHYDSTGRLSVRNIQTEEIYPGAMGSPQRQTVTMRSMNAGLVYLHFIYKRPWIGGQDIGRYVFIFEIAGDLSIKLLDTQRTVNRGYTEDSLPVIEAPQIRNLVNETN